MPCRVSHPERLDVVCAIEDHPNHVDHVGWCAPEFRSISWPNENHRPFVNSVPPAKAVVAHLEDLAKRVEEERRLRASGGHESSHREKTSRQLDAVSPRSGRIGGD